MLLLFCKRQKNCSINSLHQSCASVIIIFRHHRTLPSAESVLPIDSDKANTSSDVFRPIEEVELDEATIRHNDAVAAAIPTRLSVPSLGSTATHRTDATVRRSEEQYNDLIKSFLEPGVIVAPGDRGSRGQKVWMLVNVFCQNTGLMEFKNSQILFAMA